MTAPDGPDSAVAPAMPCNLAPLSSKAPVLFVMDAKAAERLFEFPTANIRNKSTRRAYYTAVCRFADWCEGKGLHDQTQVKPLNVAAFVESLTAALAKPTVKQHLAAVRMLSSAGSSSAGCLT